MEDIILKIIQEKASINEQDVYDFISQVAEAYKLEGYISKILFLKNESRCFSYSRSKTRLTIDLKWLLRYLGSKGDTFTTESEIFNLFFILLHEINHVFQWKKTDSEDDFEAQIYTLCLDFIGYGELPKRIHYHLLHEIYPIERMADIDALATLVNVALQGGFNYTGELNDLNYTINRGYLLGKSPLELFLATIHSDFLKQQDFYDKNRSIMIDNIASIYTPAEILRLGLPIKKEEIKRIREKIK